MGVEVSSELGTISEYFGFAAISPPRSVRASPHRKRLRERMAVYHDRGVSSQVQVLPSDFGN